MIKKSIALFLCLLALYEVFVRSSNFDWDTSQNDKSANLINAQNFIYNTQPNSLINDTIIVGSSVSRKLQTELLGNHYRNLAFNAWGSYDGLDLINRTNFLPKCIMVEMNFVGEQDFKAGIKSSLEPVSYYSNTFLKSLQLRNQPVGMLIGSLKFAMKSQIDAAKNKKRDNVELYNYARNAAKIEFNKGIGDSILKDRFNGLKSIIQKLEDKGVEIVFFEIPVDPEIENTRLFVDNRNYFHQTFSKSKYKYIPSPVKDDFVFSDAIHLSNESAATYTLYLKNQLKGLQPN